MTGLRSSLIRARGTQRRFFSSADIASAPRSALASTTQSLLLMGGSNGSTTFTDATGSRTWTAAGDAQINTDFGYNTALFSGNGYVSTPYDQTAFDWWTTDFSIQLWIFATSFASWNYADGINKPNLIGCADPLSGTNYWSFGPSTPNGLMFYYYNGTGVTVSTGTNPTINKLWHIVVSHPAGGGIYLGNNGTVSGPTAVSGTPLSSTSGVKLTLGKINNVGIDGRVVAALISKGAGCPLFTANYTPPPPPLTSLG